MTEVSHAPFIFYEPDKLGILFFAENYFSDWPSMERTLIFVALYFPQVIRYGIEHGLITFNDCGVGFERAICSSCYQSNGISALGRLWSRPKFLSHSMYE